MKPFDTNYIYVQVTRDADFGFGLRYPPMKTDFSLLSRSLSLSLSPKKPVMSLPPFLSGPTPQNSG